MTKEVLDALALIAETLHTHQKCSDVQKKLDNEVLEAKRESEEAKSKMANVKMICEQQLRKNEDLKLKIDAMNELKESLTAFTEEYQNTVDTAKRFDIFIPDAEIQTAATNAAALLAAERLAIIMKLQLSEDQLNNDNKQLKKNNEELNKTKKILIDDIRVLKKDVEKLTKGNERLHKGNEKLYKVNKKLLDDVAVLNEHNEDLKNTNEKLTDDVEKLKKTNEETKEILQKLLEEIESFHCHLREIDTKMTSSD